MSDLFTAAETERFLKYLEVGRDDECWPWKGYCCRGYGTFWIRGTNARAHRIAWMMHYEEQLPEGVPVLHHCDNPSCNNPLHLYPGTFAENSKDMVRKGRQAKGKRTAHRAQMTEDQVRWIWEELKRGKLSQGAMARQVGFNQSNISDIKRGKKWKWFTETLG